MGKLEKSLGRELVLPKRKISSVEEFIRIYPEVRDLFIDGTEREIERPQAPKRQKRHYSGKKKRHTRKYMVINDEKRRVLFLGQGKGGKCHDWRLLQRDGVLESLPSEMGVWVDLGFQGIKSRYPELGIEIPHKKPKGGELSEAQREENKVISGIRILSEHAIAGIKRLRSVKDLFRNKKIELADQFMFLACGIWNHHLKFA